MFLNSHPDSVAYKNDGIQILFSLSLMSTIIQTFNEETGTSQIIVKRN